MASMSPDSADQFGMALQAHLVGPIPKLERGLIGGRICGVGVVAVDTRHPALLETLASEQRFHNERALVESLISITGFDRKLAIGSGLEPRKEKFALT